MLAYKNVMLICFRRHSRILTDICMQIGEDLRYTHIVNITYTV